MGDSLSEEMQKWVASLTPEERAILGVEEDEPKPTAVIIEDLTGLQKAIQTYKEDNVYKCDFVDAEGKVCGKEYSTNTKLGAHKQWHTRDKKQIPTAKAQAASVAKKRLEKQSIDYKQATETLQKETSDLYKEIARLEKQIKSLLSDNDTLNGLHAELEELKHKYNLAVQASLDLSKDLSQALRREQHLKDKLMALQERFIDKLDGGS